MTLDEAAALLAKAGIESPRTEARLLLAHAMGMTRDQSLSATPTPEQSARFTAFITRRAAHEPSAYITGHKEFWSLDVAVGPGVLVPRPETETLIEEAIKLFPGRDAPLKIADLGTGSGAILLAALKEFPNATGIGIESSPEAAGWARRNAAGQARAEVRLNDWDQATGPFDLVFSNPPYIASGEIAGLMPEVSIHEPRAALDGGSDGLDAYRALARLLPHILKPCGYAVLELGFGQAPAMEPLFQGYGLEIRRVAPDLAGIPRALVLEKTP